MRLQSGGVRLLKFHPTASVCDFGLRLHGNFLVAAAPLRLAWLRTFDPSRVHHLPLHRGRLAFPALRALGHPAPLPPARVPLPRRKERDCAAGKCGSSRETARRRYRKCRSCRATAMISCLSSPASGRNSGMGEAAPTATIFCSVCEATCPRLSPVTMASA